MGRENRRPELILIALLITSPLVGQDVVHIGVNNAPPYRIVEGTKFSGIYVDIINEALRNLGMRVEYEETPLTRLWLDIKSGRIDMMLGPNYTAERADTMMFLLRAALPKERKVFYSKNLTIASYEDLYRYTIGCLRGSTFNERFDEDPNIQKVQLNDVVAGMLMVAAGRIDAIVLPERQGAFLVREQKLTLTPSTFGFEGKPSYVVLSKNSRLVSKLPEIEQALNRLIANGEVERIMARYR